MPEIKMQQADATSWMAMFSEYVAHVTRLAKTNEIYEEISASFRHFKYCLGNASYWKERSFALG
jgi:hypothetical protein